MENQIYIILQSTLSSLEETMQTINPQDSTSHLKKTCPCYQNTLSKTGLDFSESNKGNCIELCQSQASGKQQKTHIHVAYYAP